MQKMYEVIDGLDERQPERPFTVGEVKERPKRVKKQGKNGVVNGLFLGGLIAYVVFSGLSILYAYSIDPLLAMVSFANLFGSFMILFLLVMVQKNILLFIMRK